MYTCTQCGKQKAKDKFTYYPAYKEQNKLFIKKQKIQLPFCQDCIDSQRRQKKLAVLIWIFFVGICVYLLTRELFLTRAAAVAKLAGLLCFLMLLGITFFSALIAFRSDNTLFVYFMVKKKKEKFLPPGFTLLYADFQVRKMHKEMKFPEVVVLEE